MAETVDNVRRQQRKSKKTGAKEPVKEPFDFLHRRSISGDMKQMIKWKPEKPSLPDRESLSRRPNL